MAYTVTMWAGRGRNKPGARHQGDLLSDRDIRGWLKAMKCRVESGGRGRVDVKCGTKWIASGGSIDAAVRNAMRKGVTP